MLLNMEDDAIVSAQDRAGAYEPCARALRLEIPRSRCLESDDLSVAMCIVVIIIGNALCLEVA